MHSAQKPPGFNPACTGLTTWSRTQTQTHIHTTLQLHVIHAEVTWAIMVRYPYKHQKREEHAVAWTETGSIESSMV